MMSERKFFENRNKVLLISVLFMIFIICVSRALSIEHGMNYHPDEHVFYQGSDSLKDMVLGRTDTFEEKKEYPEGALVMYLPFHIAADVLNHLAGRELIIPQLAGRIGAVSYFVLGCILGGFIIYRYLSRKWAVVLLYLIITAFSVVHLELSRYGTGDVISFALVMLMVLLSSLSLENGIGKKKKLFFMVGAFFVCGALTAVKYPLLYFVLIPLYSAICFFKTERSARKYVLIPLLLAALVLAFALLSPKAAADPMYVVRASTRELTSYLVSANTEFGGAANHVLSIAAYSILYSGFPFWPVFFVLAVRILNKEKNSDSPVHILFSKVLPITISIFLTYNVFVKNLYMRTLYPMFFLTDIYVAYAVYEYSRRVGLRKTVTYVLLLVMTIRGCWMTCIMTDKDERVRILELIEASTDENWNRTTGLNLEFSVLPRDISIFENREMTHIWDERYDSEETMPVEKGELIITGALDYSLYAPYMIPLSIYENDPQKQEAAEMMERWNRFKEVNRAHYRGGVYPEYYYWLLGCWIKGTTMTDYEFPTTYIYYLNNTEETTG